MNRNKIKRLTRNAMLTTIALIIFVVETHIPVPVPIPGVKLVLANVITVYAMFLFRRWYVLLSYDADHA